MANHAAVSLEACASVVKLNYFVGDSQWCGGFIPILANIGISRKQRLLARRRPSWLRMTLLKGAQGGLYALLD